MHVPSKFLFDGLQLRPHAVASSLPLDEELAALRRAAGHARKAQGLRRRSPRRPSVSDVVKEFLHSAPRHRCDVHLAEKRLDSSIEPAAVDREGACALRLFAPSANLSRQRVFKVAFAQFFERQRLPNGDLLGAGVGAATISPRSASARSCAGSGVHGLPWRPIVIHRCRASAVRYLGAATRSG
jgi:hypothetical protein